MKDGHSSHPPASSPAGAAGIIEQLRGRPTCSIVEASRLLGVGRSTAYAAAHDGSLPTIRLSHRLLVPTARLLAMVGMDAETLDKTPAVQPGQHVVGAEEVVSAG